MPRKRYALQQAISEQGTQDKCAKAIGINRAIISGLINYRHTITVLNEDQMERLIEYTKKPIEELFSQDDLNFWKKRS